MDWSRQIWNYTVQVVKFGLTSWKGLKGAVTVLSLLIGGLTGYVLTRLGVSEQLATCVALAIVFLVVAPFRAWLAERKIVLGFEEAARPKLAIELFEQIDPKGARGKAVREFRLKVRNVSTGLIRGCYVVKESFINNRGDESDSIGQRFKLSSEVPIHIQGYEHKQSFDLASGATEIISLMALDEITHPNANVIMLYAAKGAASGQVRNAVPQQFFPHVMTLGIYAENMVSPIKLAYRCHIQNGRLRLDAKR